MSIDHREFFRFPDDYSLGPLPLHNSRSFLVGIRFIRKTDESYFLVPDVTRNIGVRPGSFGYSLDIGIRSHLFRIPYCYRSRTDGHCNLIYYTSSVGLRCCIAHQDIVFGNFKAASYCLEQRRQRRVLRNFMHVESDFFVAYDCRLHSEGKSSLEHPCYSGRNCCPTRGPLFISSGLGSIKVHRRLWIADCSTAGSSISCNLCRRDFLLLGFDSGYDRCFENPDEHSDDLDFVRTIRS